MATTEENPKISEPEAVPTKKGRSKKASNPITTTAEAMASPAGEEIAQSDLAKQVEEMQEELEKLKIVKEETEAIMKGKEEELDRLYNKIKEESNAKVEEAKSIAKVGEDESDAKVKGAKTDGDSKDGILLGRRSKRERKVPNHLKDFKLG
ncbi:hypothetical protein AAHA92_12858 [Salvia divinorum]|uniref:Uncharacterized protein n=1 Tax=Salvia divinorum TaxID=28513 RepID=A0ABD1H9R2_SALDI